MREDARPWNGKGCEGVKLSAWVLCIRNRERRCSGWFR